MLGWIVQHTLISAARGVIVAYQRTLSPLLGTRCRYTPTCSQYAREAIEEYGLIKGGSLALLRMMRCNILFEGGYDPPVRRSGTSE